MHTSALISDKLVHKLWSSYPDHKLVRTQPSYSLIGIVSFMLSLHLFNPPLPWPMQECLREREETSPVSGGTMMMVGSAVDG